MCGCVWGCMDAQQGARARVCVCVCAYACADAATISRSLPSYIRCTMSTTCMLIITLGACLLLAFSPHYFKNVRMSALALLKMVGAALPCPASLLFYFIFGAGRGCCFPPFFLSALPIPCLSSRI